MQTETVTRLRAGTVTDPYSGEDAEDWSAPTEVDIVTLAPAEPRPSGEPLENARNALVNGWTLYLPYGSDVTARDRMLVRGEEYPVQGTPADWLGAGIVVQAFRTEG
jgi:hypothetical protein